MVRITEEKLLGTSNKQVSFTAKNISLKLKNSCLPKN